MTSEPLPRPPPGWRAGLLLVVLWMACTALNLFKAVHIDDAVHLALAEQIARDPLHPMQAVVFWSSAPAPAHELNQPHLFFYLLAGLLAMGASITGLHVAVSAFAGVALLGTHRLVRAVTGDELAARFAAAALGLGPALGPSQNLMTDVPLLALWVLAVLAILGRETDRVTPGRLALGGLAVGVACLVKYTSLALLPLLGWWLWRQHRRQLWVLVVPLVVLAAWSAWNVWDYGGVHLIERRISVTEDAPTPLAMVGLTFGRAALWVLTLGAVTPFTLAFVPRAAARFGGRRLAIGLAIALPLLTLGGQLLASHGPEVLRGETVVHSFLRGLFFANGVLAIVLSVGAVRRHWGVPSVPLLAAWAAGVSVFIIVLSPFVAVRHVLLALPPLLGLLFIDREVLPSPRLRAVALGASLLIGVGVGVADWRIADAYRQLPARLEAQLGDAPRVLFVGHWGFQHYATEAGWTPYVPGQTELREGDRIVRPRSVDQPPFDPADAARLSIRETVVVEASMLDLFRTVTPRLGYYSVWHGLPWTLSLEALETVEILEVSPTPRRR